MAVIEGLPAGIEVSSGDIAAALARRRLGYGRGARQKFEQDALDELYRLTDGYPYFVQAYGKVTWDVALGSPVTAEDVHEAAPDAEAELAVGFFGARYDRATPAERDYMTAMADLGAEHGDAAIPTADVARHLGRKPQSLSPARDGLIKKGLVYSGERGSVAFTVPHFGKFLRAR